jgi:hypothetical protein
MAMRESDRHVLADGARPRTARGADGRLPPVSTAPPAGGQAHPATTLPEDLPVMYRELIDADNRSDPAALARVGWQLFSMICVAQQAHSEAHGLLSELRSAARAAIAGQGSPGSLALLRDVLARHGWLPPAGATPLQVLAAPAAQNRSHR